MKLHPAEKAWQVNPVQLGALAACVCLGAVALAVRPLGGSVSQSTSGQETLRIPEFRSGLDLDQALARLVSDSFTRGRGGGKSAQPVERQTTQVVKVAPTPQRLTPPPRPLAVNLLLDGSTIAYYPASIGSEKLTAKRRGEKVGRWTIIEISQSFIRYRHDDQEIKHTLFGSDDGG